MKSIKMILTAILLGISILTVSAQNQPPQVTNVLFSQRTDGTLKVDVNYDLNDPEGSSMTVTMKVSDDNGVTWNFSCNSITGDVGTGITNGKGKHIEWDFGLEHQQTFGDQFRIKIIADDGGIVMGIPCPGIPTITDPRDGKEYNTVLIGEQCWLKENMNIGTRIDGSLDQTDNLIIEKYCYDNDSNNCNIYGGLYQWNEAMQYATNESAQGICPPGWHLPTLAEFQTLSSTVGGDGNALKREDQGSGGGQGTNTSGFSALLAGVRDTSGSFGGLGYVSSFWSSTVYNASHAHYLYLVDYGSGIGATYGFKVSGTSVRCVKD